MLLSSRSDPSTAPFRRPRLGPYVTPKRISSPREIGGATLFRTKIFGAAGSHAREGTRAHHECAADRIANHSLPGPPFLLSLGRSGCPLENAADQTEHRPCGQQHHQDEKK